MVLSTLKMGKLKKTVLYVFLLIVAHASVAQNHLSKKITLNANKEKLDVVFEKLSKQCQCYFTYDARLIDGAKKVTVKTENQPLKAVLDTLLYDSAFLYREFRNQIIIYPPGEEPTKAYADSSAYFEISGKVIRADDKAPLPFATIAVKGTSMGTITNENGQFKLKIDKKHMTDTLQVSFVGYYDKQVTLQNIEGPLTIELKPGQVSLQEVIIRSTSGAYLVKKARKEFKNNYNSSAYNYEGFYREAVKSNSRYKFYTEALLQGYKPSWNAFAINDKVALIKARKYTSLYSSDTLLIKLRGGIATCFQLDIVRNIPDFLMDSGEDMYNYQLNDIKVWKNTLVYVVSFHQKEYVKTAHLEGAMYISINDFAITGAEFRFNPDMLKESRDMFVLRKSRKIKVTPEHTNYQVAYSKINGRYYLRHVRGELSLKVKKRGHFFAEKYATTMEMVTTDIDTVNVFKPDRKELVKVNSIFSEPEVSYSQEYWKSINSIIPEKNILDALKSSGFKLEKEQ